MNSQEINQRIADAIGEGDLHFVMKRGLYYRPMAQGYTSNPDEAWRLPLAEAKAHECLRGDEPVTLRKCPPRNFCGSLDAMRVAEEVIPRHLLARYTHEILCKTAWNTSLYASEDTIRYSLALASPAVRAEAFIELVERDGLLVGRMP